MSEKRHRPALKRTSAAMLPCARGESSDGSHSSNGGERDAPLAGLLRTQSVPDEAKPAPVAHRAPRASAPLTSLVAIEKAADSERRRSQHGTEQAERERDGERDHEQAAPAAVVDAVVAAATASNGASHGTASTADAGGAGAGAAAAAVSPRRSPARPRKLTRTTTYRDYIKQIYHRCPDNKCTDNCFFGDFLAERRTRDYNYHMNYSRARQLFQDKLIWQTLKEGISPESPRLVFTGGAMGAGKGFALKRIAPQVGVVLDEFVKIDPDQIKEMLPEYQMLKKKDPSIAGSQVHQESGFIQEIVQERALSLSKNVLVDGSLRDWQWNLAEIERIEREFPAYAERIDIVFVNANEETVMRRARERGEVTGRVIPAALLRETYRQVPRSIEVLKHAARKTYFVNNENHPFIESTYVNDFGATGRKALQQVVTRTKSQAEMYVHTLRDTAIGASADGDRVTKAAMALQQGLPTMHRINASFVFSGRAAATWLLENGFASSRDDALQLGQTMLEQGVFKHVPNGAMFEDNSRRLYRFLRDDFDSKPKMLSAKPPLHIEIASLDTDCEGSGIAILVLKMLDAEFERDPDVQITIHRYPTIDEYAKFIAVKRKELAQHFKPARFHNSAPLCWFNNDQYIGGCNGLLLGLLKTPKFARSMTISANLAESFFLRELVGDGRSTRLSAVV